MKKRKKPHKGRPGKGGEPNPGRWGKPHIQRKDAHIMSSASISYYIKREMSSGKEHKNAKI